LFVLDNEDYKQEKVGRIQLQTVVSTLWNDGLCVWYSA